MKVGVLTKGGSWDTPFNKKESNRTVSKETGGTDKEEGDTQKEFENEGKVSKKFKPS